MGVAYGAMMYKFVDVLLWRRLYANVLNIKLDMLVSQKKDCTFLNGYICVQVFLVTQMIDIVFMCVCRTFMHDCMEMEKCVIL